MLLPWLHAQEAEGGARPAVPSPGSALAAAARLLGADEAALVRALTAR